MLRSIYVIAVLVSLLTASSIPAQELIEVERYVWTDNVDPSTREAMQAHKSPVRRQQIYLWTQIKGSRELLERMRANADGQILIRHLWQRYDTDQLVVELDMPLNVGRKEDLRKLAYEVDALGFFRWRTWSHKQYLRRGHWRVDIVYDESYDPVMCGSASAKKPCSFAIEVR